MKEKPKKKTDNEIYTLLSEKIENLEYIFMKHAKERLKNRNINDLEVIHILEGKKGRKRKRNKSKDDYKDGRSDWNYCIEGINIDGIKIRIIISFENESMLIITVIRLD